MTMQSKVFLATTIFVIAVSNAVSADPPDQRLNVVILYVDDMGFGDLEIQNPDSKIPTPFLNELARSGMRFTDGHSSSGICTPSRYALLTGRHHFRKFHGIVNALGKSVIDSDRLTMPEMFRECGYETACIGKWHLGWDWDALKKDNAQPQTIEGTKRKVWPHEAFDWTRQVPDGPLTHGFDYYFGDAVINFPPYCWIENDKVVEPPDSTLTRVSGVAKEGNWEARPGPALADWDFYEVLPTLTQKGVEYIQSRKNQESPFFLYFAFPSPHAPIVPTDEFNGKSQAGPYGDFVNQTDWCCGQLLQSLETAGLTENTIVIFTSDNGPERYAYARAKEFDHWSAAPFRGLKRDIYEGGHHVPFIIRWPGATEPDSLCEQLVSQIDLMATLAAMLEFKLPEDAAEDSHDLLPLISGETANSPRTVHVHNTFKDRYAIRDGKWLLIDGVNGYHSRGFEGWEKRNGYPADNQQPVELFDIASDPEQKHNIAADHAAVVHDLRQNLTAIKNGKFTAPRLENTPESDGNSRQ